MNIAGSFSGGRSSARMVKEVQDRYPEANVIWIMANSTQEHLKTWKFTRQVDEHFGMNLVKVEAVISPEMNVRTGHRVVDYDGLKLKGEIFEEMIRKYGIPNDGFPHCTRELKTNPFYSYLDSIGWKRGTYKVALGIRADEPKRINEKAAELGIIYPLVEAGIDKRDVLEFWRGMPFDLEIKEREGNCTWCWKKSETKHILNAQHNPQWYEFPDRMERQYSNVRPERGPQYFFRGHKSASQLLALAKALPVQLDMFEADPEENGGCAESCEAIV